MSEQPQDTGLPVDAAGDDVEASALDIASWEIGSWEESTSDSDGSICSFELYENILSVSLPDEDIEGTEGSDDGRASLTSSTTIYPGPNGLDLDEEYFTYLDSSSARSTSPEDEQDGENSIIAVSQRISIVLQRQFPVHSNSWTPKRTSQTPDEILERFFITP